MYILILVMSLGVKEGVTSQQIPGYTKEECSSIVSGREGDSQVRAYCIKAPAESVRS